MHKFYFISIICCLTLHLHALDTTSDSFEPLQNGYKSYILGMGQDEIEEELSNSSEFNIIREEILSVRMEPDTDIISTEGYGFVTRAYFHFNNEKLFQIYLIIDEQKVGYYPILKTYINKYGNPSSFSPDRAVWENNEVMVILEKPCTLKYVDKKVWDSLLSKDHTTDTVFDKIRRDFIDSL